MMVSNEQKAITKKRTTWQTENSTSLKGTVSKRHFSADDQLCYGGGMIVIFQFPMYLL
jgi:hypothetical protein